MPSAAERIMIIAEKNQNFHMEMQKTALHARITDVKRGQYCALVLCICAFGVAVIAIYEGDTIVASWVALTTVISLAGSFIVGRIVKSNT